jgi:hypothetical protein
LKLQRFATFAIVFGYAVGLSVSSYAEERSGAISGYVRNAAGTPQMGAVVEILGDAHHSLTVFTNESGFYTAAGLLPGLYSLKVTAPSFLPALRESIGLDPGAMLRVNITLSTLLGVMQLGPIRGVKDDDDWKWTLRSVANRPILRVFNDPTIGGPEAPTHQFSGVVSFLAGSPADGYGAGSDMSTNFTVERSVFSGGLISLSGNVAYGDTLPSAVLRTSYSHQMSTGSDPHVSLTVRRLAPSDPAFHYAALQSLELAAGDDFTLGDTLELKFGSQIQTVQFLGHLNAFRPYGSANFHLSPNTVLAYDYATSRPGVSNANGFASDPVNLNDSDPRITMQAFSPKIENAHHNELSLSRRMGNTKLQFAAFTDTVDDPALTGAGEVTGVGGYLLPDIASGTFSFTGRKLDTGGARVVLQRKFASDVTATIDYAYGGVLSLSGQDVSLQNALASMSTQRRHAIAAKLAGVVPRTHTRWMASYRWINGTALTPVDMFNASAGQSEGYFNILIRQPIPCLAGHVEAMIDLRNLLAQGYVPVVGRDGQTVYLVDSARSVRGGVAFTF